MSGAEELRGRAFRFACQIIIFCRRLMPRGPVQKHIAVQLVMAATSVGANLEEARESHYWLRIIQATEQDLKVDVQPLLGEANEFVAILTTLVRTARSNSKRGGAI